MDVLGTTAHRPYPLPAGPWRMRQRWNDLLFAHWPVRPEVIQTRLPEGLEVDRYDGAAWLGVVPFTMDRVRTRVAGQLALGVLGARAFPELNLRTYVRSRRTGLAGVYFFSLDAGSLLAVLGARVLFHLPYFWARMRSERLANSTVGYSSSRVLGRQRATFAAEYRGNGLPQPSVRGSIEAFLTERYCLFTESRGRGWSATSTTCPGRWSGPKQPSPRTISPRRTASRFPDAPLRCSILPASSRCTSGRSVKTGRVSFSAGLQPASRGRPATWGFAPG